VGGLCIVFMRWCGIAIESVGSRVDSIPDLGPQGLSKALQSMETIDIYTMNDFAIWMLNRTKSAVREESVAMQKPRLPTPLIEKNLKVQKNPIDTQIRQ
jgi:hypothetical protein